MRSTFCLFLFLNIWALSGFSQSPGQLKLDHLTIEDGLSQSSGLAILQDRYGYMWFGTLNGLNKFNGYDFTIYEYDAADSTSLTSSHISYLFEDSRGNLWIGTTGAGINLYNRKKDNFSNYRTDYVDHHLSISDNSVSSIIEGPGDKFWIGTNSGLNLFDRDTEEFIHFYAVDDQPKTLSSSNITSLFLDSSETLWIGTTKGLNYWDDMTGTFGHYKNDPSDPYSISHNVVSAIYEDTSGNLWVGTNEGGLHMFDPSEEKFYNYRYDEDDPYSISGNSILTILEDSRDVLWIGTENQGLNVFDREEQIFHRYKSNVSNPASLKHNSVYSLYENSDNILWIGTYSGGISSMNRKFSKFEHYKHDPFDPKPLSNNNVTSFLETSGGIFLVGTDGGGLNLFDRESHEFTLYTHEPDNPSTLSSDVILALHQDRNGKIWIGYYNGGVSVFDPSDGSFEHYRHDPEDSDGLRNDHVFVIHEGNDGELWFGTNGGGVHQLDPETGNFTLIATETDGSTVIRDLLEDSYGYLWIGSYGGGLIQVDKNTGSIINQYIERTNGLTSNVILTIHEDQERNLWIGSHEGGLHLFHRESETFTTYSVNEGLPSAVVRGILEDENGNLWLSTGGGLSMFNPSTKTFSNYNIEHGTQSNEFNPLSYYKDRDGFMYFGGINGFNRFHPKRVAIEEAVPPVVLTDFKVFNQSLRIDEDSPLKNHISQTEEIELPYTASVLTIDYVALNFNKNKGDEFAYILEGFDNDWNYVGTRRSATYTNLNPGTYTFRVKAANSYGVWSDSETFLTMTITPPFWKTAWFYLLLVFFITGVIASALQWRLASITKQNQRLEREVKKQTADLCDKNKELEKTLTELKAARSELVDRAHKAGMADLATNVLHNVGNILNSVNVSVSLIEEIIKRSKLKGFNQANKLLKENLDDLENFILNDPKGKKLLHYISKLEEPLNREQEELAEQTDRLNQNMQLMIDVVNAQQSFSHAAKVTEVIQVEKLIEDTLLLQTATIERHGLDLVTDYQAVSEIEIEKSKVVHILVNLFKNAKEAMSGLGPNEKKLSLKTFQDDNYVYLSVIDNGCGISKENLKKIFNHGFTTKSYGHGFGLHSCANYMKELKGEIRVESDGPGKGTAVTLCFPRKHPKNEFSTFSRTQNAAKIAEP
ncbi:GHKL domain-containing protein [Rhodohalobacter sp. SW132]|uniref:sensor histidine kinase n=1 Tax=Rhodohalobacter sp. SW132 TaxID=2293433 RepID=UPI000E21DCEF|nr:sensor histidine kinase [Rhodohalobacter sp. SW132]REL24619.1 GHKL domain-containing protein [Rhodohalobacter sp. SW132]